jgi:oligopeptide transport system ATP-binding protein
MLVPLRERSPAVSGATPVPAGNGRLAGLAGAGGSGPLLEVRNVVQEFVVRDYGGVKGGVVHAVSDVSFELWPGETLGIVGETGSGKSTLARSLLQAPRPKSGAVIFGGTDLVTLKGRRLLDARRQMQMVFQDPFGSLDPKWRVEDIVCEPLTAYRIGDRAARRSRVSEVLELVGLDPGAYSGRLPRQLSGGQCQRVAIARAIALSPALIVCDEAVSSLDVLIQAQVLNLFERLRGELGLSYLFIAHDLALVKQVSDRVAVMYLGKLCEVGPAESLYTNPQHPYTLALLESIPSPDPEAPRMAAHATIRGEPPSPIHPPSGCRFRTRCPRAQERCALEEPQMRTLGDSGHTVACHFPLPAGTGPHPPGEAAATASPARASASGTVAGPPSGRPNRKET